MIDNETKQILYLLDNLKLQSHEKMILSVIMSFEIYKKNTGIDIDFKTMLNMILKQERYII